MKAVYALALICFFSVSATSQTVNLELKAELDSIMTLDQGTRQLTDQNITKEKKSEILQKIGYTEKEFDANPWGIITKHDSLNQKRIYEILDQYGYPGKSLVGTPTHLSAWLVIQHSGAIEKYFPLIKEAGEQEELPMQYVGLMEDRLLMQQGREQVYGTQAWGSALKNAPKGKGDQVFIIWPIKDPETVNQRREQAGFTNTVEEYARQMEIDYKVYTLEEVKNMFKHLPGTN
ncbi:DUF6624 domain-containing protein [Robertkochia flava]|uniref:DUF6624 domain-containing protein n=1 Tax=Robertkochia flava TaxID=3447986 RepID=UPI001CCAB69C|nr:DUF6624 domain-containing protein [Robertkochia marina]